MENIESHVFTPEEVAAVRAAIRAAGDSMREYDRQTRPDPEKLRQPMTPPSQMGNSSWGRQTDLIERAPRLPFTQVLRDAINGQSMENGSNTPDWILADFLHSVLNNLDAAIAQRDKWYGVKLEPGVHRCREYDWEHGERVTINVGAIFKIGKRLWRLTAVPKKQQGDDLWIFECADDSGGISCDRFHNFTRSEVQWLYSHGSFVGQPVDAEGAVL